MPSHDTTKRTGRTSDKDRALPVGGRGVDDVGVCRANSDQTRDANRPVPHRPLRLTAPQPGRQLLHTRTHRKIRQ
ncbi:hypothetical protein, partial [Streptomyces sp. NPDC088184]|uniref:hypothetical protein n=1 Tax=Streptomyces sp. NPDC088184 TaxID=3160991 RepID=UPI0034352CCA